MIRCLGRFAGLIAALVSVCGAELPSSSPIYASTDFGQTWTAVGAGIPAKTRVVLLESRGSRLLAGTDGDGLYLSDSERKVWKQIGAGLPGIKITALYAAGDEIYAGVFRKGLFLTRDEGKTWIPQNEGLGNLDVRAISKTGESVVVATDGGLFRKSDAHWTNAFSACQVVSLNASGHRMIAGGVLGTLQSTDVGVTWDWISKAGAAHNTAALGEKVVVMNISGDLLLSDDFGASWAKADYFPRAGSYVYDTVKAGESILISNNYGIHRSNDGGKTWRHIFKTEEMAFMDLLAVGNTVYGGTVGWNERRKKSTETFSLGLDVVVNGGPANKKGGDASASRP